MSTRERSKKKDDEWEGEDRNSLIDSKNLVCLGFDGGMR
jgi:hypothetical protein